GLSRWRGNTTRRQYRALTGGLSRWRGNTPELPPGLIEVTVYPRWRGEHANKLRFYGSLNGLSPLARGTRSSPTR
ncbi:hypothetical protein SEEU8388_15614, partial [Salmonella enterica subsp. enterica serovar Muenchen str. ATCC 8388]